MNIVLPNTTSIRPYQNDAMSYFDNGGTRACTVWHRRAGKDYTAIHQIAKMSHQRRGLYWHMLPTQRQARKVVWEAITKGGDRLIDAAFPRQLRQGDINNTEMRITLKCGSIYQLVGSDNYESLIGSNPVGVVFSEWSLTDPRVWDYIRPILLENDGWAWFIYTPRGYNHGWDIKEIAENSDEWFYSMKNVEDTGVVSTEQIDQERRDGMPEELVQQEFYCSFSSANVGAILGSYVETAMKEGRINEEVQHDPEGSTVFVSCDIGFRDTAAFWFWQAKPDGVALLNYLEDSGLDATDWIERLQKIGYGPLDVYLPHDAKAKTFAIKHSALEQFLKAGFNSVRLVPKTTIADRINAGRAVMPHARFSKTATERGLMSLRDWSYSWDDRRKIFSKDPLHNWASHGADGWTYGAQVAMQHVKDWGAKLKAASSKIVLPNQEKARGAHYAFTLEQLYENRQPRISRI